MVNYILDENDQGIFGASILLSKDDTVFRASTNQEGNYIVYGLTEGEWSLSIYYQALCSTDIGFIPPLDAPHSIEITETQQEIFYLHRDHDQDSMPSFWEEEVGLNPYFDDSAEDPDNDGMSNVEEYWAGTNPFDSTDSVQPKECGCSNGNAAFLSPLLLLLWRRDA